MDEDGMDKKYQPLLLLVLFFLILSLANCRNTTSPENPLNEAQGTITISGAWALYPMMVRWAELYQAENPQVNFDISAGGAGKGMADALAGAVDIGMVSREIYPEEVGRGAFWVSVVKDAVFLTVNESNPAWEEISKSGLTKDTLVGIFIDGTITTWGEAVNSKEIVEPIHVFTRSDAAGAPATWAEYLGYKQEDLLGIGVYGDPGLLDAVIKDPLGIGYNNLNYAYDQDSGLPISGARVAPIDFNDNGLADTNEEYDTKEKAIKAVADNIYPSPPARDLNLVTLGKPSGLTLNFISWVLTEGQLYVSESGYIGLPSEKLELELSKLH